MKKLILVDNHAIFRAGLREIIGRNDDMQVIAEADNGAALLELLERHACDLALMDMSMPGLHGVELIRAIRRAHPRLPILVLSMHSEGQIVARAVRAGASGYVTKDSEPAVLLAAIRKVCDGGRFIDPALVDKVVFDVTTRGRPAPHETLSEREAEVFRMMVNGCGTNDIAQALAISAKTVSTYKMRILQKLEEPNLIGLVRYALDHGLVE